MKKLILAVSNTSSSESEKANIYISTSSVFGYKSFWSSILDSNISLEGVNKAF